MRAKPGGSDMIADEMPELDSEYLPGLCGRYLVATVSGEKFALDSESVSEIIECVNMTELPMAGPVVRGGVSVRSELALVIDLAARLGRGRSGRAGEQARIILLDAQQTGEWPLLGLFVDSVDSVLHVDSVLSVQCSRGDVREGDSCIAGISVLDSTVVNLLNLSKVLDIAELTQLVVR